MSDGGDTIERAAFVDLMAGLPAPVAVITTRRDDRPVGLAVTSFGPYSAEPPSVMVSVGRHARSYEPLLAAEAFGAHLLSSDQEDVALMFASRADDKFGGLDWAWHGAVPRLGGAAAFLLCRKECVLSHGDHAVLIGAVEEVKTVADAEPLMFLRRRYSWRLVDQLG